MKNLKTNLIILNLLLLVSLTFVEYEVLAININYVFVLPFFIVSFSLLIAIVKEEDTKNKLYRVLFLNS